MEESERIEELPERVALLFSGKPVAPDEPAGFQVFQNPGERPVVLLPDGGQKFLPRHAGAPSRHRLHGGGVGLGAAEERGVEPSELAVQSAGFAEAEPVDGLRGAFAAPDQAPVERDSAERQVEVGQLPVGQAEPFRGGKAPALAEREGHEPDQMRQAVVEPAVVVDDLPHDPRRRRTADDQDDVVPPRRPSVPEMLERRHEPGVRRFCGKSIENGVSAKTIISPLSSVSPVPLGCRRGPCRPVVRRSRGRITGCSTHLFYKVKVSLP